MKKTYRISIWSIVVLALLVGGLALFALYFFFTDLFGKKSDVGHLP